MRDIIVLERSIAIIHRAVYLLGNNSVHET